MPMIAFQLYMKSKKNEKEVSSFIEDLEQYVYDFENLDLLVIVDNFIGQSDKDMVFSKNNNLYFIQNIFPIQKQILIIVNEYSAKKEEARTLSSDIKKAFVLSNTILF
jgi:hypothetical protein